MHHSPGLRPNRWFEVLYGVASIGAQQQIKGKIIIDLCTLGDHAAALGWPTFLPLSFPIHATKQHLAHFGSAVALPLQLQTFVDLLLPVSYPI